MHEQVEAEAESDASAHWSYELVPVRTQPVVNLSMSLKRRFLSPAIDRRIDLILRRYGRALFAFYLVSLMLNISVPLLDAPTGRLASLVCILCGLPLALLSLTTLRYDIVKLLLATYDFWFYATANLVGYLTIAISFADLRIARLLIDSLGFQNIVFVDAQLLGVKRLITSSSIAIIAINVLLVCVMLNRIDGVDFSRSIFRYRNQNHSYNVTLADIVGNGIVTMTIFLFKISYRKRMLFRRQRVVAAESDADPLARDGYTVVCAIYRCWVRFTPVQPITSTSEHVETAHPDSPEQSHRSRLQQLNYVKRVDSFDSRRTLLPISIRSHALFARRFLVPLYASAIGGVVFNCAAVAIAAQTSSSSGITDVYRRSNLVCAALALSLTACFVVSCTALHQREVLKSLLTSFDFGFYAVQMVIMHACVCVLYSRYLPVVFAAVASMMWAFWLLTLDALTPMMKTKLGFNVRSALIVAVAGLLLHSTILYHVLGDWGPLDRTIWEGSIFQHRLQIRVIPFYISRVVTIVPWFLRFVWRIAQVSNSDAIILRAAVTYQNRMYLRTAPKAIPSATPLTPSTAAESDAIHGSRDNRIVPARAPLRPAQLTAVAPSPPTTVRAASDPG